MTLKSILATVAIFSSVTASVFAQEGVDLLRAMEAKYSGVQSVAGTMTQERVDKTFNKKSETPATFKLLKPSNFRVDLAGTDPSVNLISGKTSYNYVPKLKQVAVYEFSNQSNIRDLNYILLGFGAKTDDVLKVYTVAPLKGKTGITLTPRDTSQSTFKSISMEVEKDSLLPKRFSMEERDGTEVGVNLNLPSLQLNAPLSQKDFQPDFPKDAQRVKLQ